MNRKYKIFFFAVLPVFTACVVTEKQRARICNTCATKSERSDSTVIKTVTVSVFIPGAPGPTLYLENPCKLLCDEFGNLRKFDTVVRSNGQTVHLQNLGNGFHVSTATSGTTVAVSVQQKETHSREVKESAKYIPCANERTSFDGFTRWWFYITALGGALYALYIYVRRRMRPP